MEIQLITPYKAALAQPADGLEPAKAFFDPLADRLAGPVTGVAGGASVDGRCTVGVFLGNVWRHVGTAHPVHEALGVVVFVRAHRHPARAGERLDHGDGRFPFGGSRRLGHLGIHGQPMTVLHQQVSHVAEPGCRTFALSEQQRIRVGFRFMRLPPKR